MATDNAGATQADADASTSSLADTTTSSATQADADTTTLTFDDAKKLRAEAKSLRDRLRAFEDADKKRQDAQLSDQERLTKQLADLQKAHDDALARAQQLERTGDITKEAIKLGFANPDDAIALLGKLDDNANVESLLKDLIKNKPYLGDKQRASSGGATNPSRAATQAAQGITEDYVRDLLSGKLGPDAYSKLTPAQKAQVTDITSKSRWH